jgi:hypothetical protein
MERIIVPVFGRRSGEVRMTMGFGRIEEAA